MTEDGLGLYFLLARKEVYTCLSFCSQGGSAIDPPGQTPTLGRHPSGRVHARIRSNKRAVTHPTGMQSCLLYNQYFSYISMAF